MSLCVKRSREASNIIDVPCLKKSKAENLRAEWFMQGGATSREQIDENVYSVIGNSSNQFGLPKSVSKLIVDYLEEYLCFGEKDWSTLCGRVDPAPPFPEGLSSIWNGPCPIYSGKKIKETHNLVYVPTTMNNKPFTLKQNCENCQTLFSRKR